ncbi:UDP-N-acetylglucosamine--N-acetylmuramyl-(pentapeptide) pyrophosphoryl-undecaprenol N-acetylglucosamine transferase [Helicobacter sp.]|uniref:UDP-N-acetylglucosamine--N-acetylmuramyl- (pentapeptide) pyrophosphoryl-undecaprenol N-acetylglucosamine transferase n=1 Tax=Helicobacter sp. TaxID=218 RepID=UPI0025BD5228|nr:UDP-N-acetylglucosamine--N-acetylmuramyl-(pentapeptide) pyrophosphoryl-undecaprenol N-acetylglucosamine transferase [Helicobacter sp.]MCI5969067.1 UDP-N-acetylglucosamine--N-acetylmuramyl-(pentapeptide) pyrophosphoryl-undecaprenol N-acetylglucosamine transferase [Helicobacter sp.]MDY2584282.1 UDP-N-acetylglucosamine--N-acetylmuramyl-(pentapeptide) pyrophosphoryl-undecaprenol N-acetylglucosamine transferase [Helicobacter sp.]
MRIVITGGGTGGHLSVARAFLQAFVKRGYVCAFVGSDSGADAMYFKEEKLFRETHFLPTQGVVNARGVRLLKALWKQGCAVQRACGILREFRADFVLCVGGYSAAPAAFGACLLGIPLVIHEQNARIGRLNALLKPFAKVFFCSYLESPVLFYPVGQAFFKEARVRSEVRSVLFMGGSQGARRINGFALSVAEELKKRGIKVFLQSGKADLERVVQECVKKKLNVGVLGEETLDSIDGVDVVVFGFYADMASVYGRCDFAVCRAGASSLWELCANGLPALFVPYPYAAGNHQYYNAEFLVKKGLGFLCLEENLSSKVLWECLGLLEDRITQMSEDLQKECAVDAVEQMCGVIERRIKSHKSGVA